MILLAFNKPYNVVCQFRPHADDQTLANFIEQQGVYPAGRLDKDSEGLLLLTDNGDLQHQISQPDQKMRKGYWVQVEGIPEESALALLRKGVQLKDGITKPAQVKIMDAPPVWERNPPIRERKNIPTCWLDITISEGRNRQVRRMTAAIGFPTLRLIRYRIGSWYLNNLLPGICEERNIPASLLNKIQSRQKTGKHSQHKHRRNSKT